MPNNNANLELYKCFIQPGQVAFSKDPSLICSVCGNGLLVIIHDRIKKIGGIAHCIYPKSNRLRKPSNFQVDIAIDSLFRSLRSMHGINRNMEAQLFGGGNLRGHEKRRAERVVKRANKILKRLDINIVSQDIGGNLGRKVMFNTDTGEIVVHKTRNIRQVDWMPEIQRGK